MSAASYHLHEDSFGIEQIYLDDQRDVSYDVNCELSKADCKIAPDSVCDAVSSEVIFQNDEDQRALSFEDAFDGDSEAKVYPRRLQVCKDWMGGTTHQHEIGGGDASGPLWTYEHNCPRPGPPPKCRVSKGETCDGSSPG